MILSGEEADCWAAIMLTNPTLDQFALEAFGLPSSALHPAALRHSHALATARAEFDAATSLHEAYDSAYPLRVLAAEGYRATWRSPLMSGTYTVHSMALFPSHPVETAIAAARRSLLPDLPPADDPDPATVLCAASASLLRRAHGVARAWEEASRDSEEARTAVTSAAAALHPAHLAAYAAITTALTEAPSLVPWPAGRAWTT